MKVFSHAVLLLTVILSSQAFADAQPGQGYFSPMGTFIDDDPDRGVDDEFSGGQLGFGVVVNDKWNIEAIIQAAYMSGFAPQDQFGIGLDLQRIFNREGRVSPYLFFGVGYMESELSGMASRDGGMASAGAGLLLDVFGDSDVALRIEYRHRTDDAQTSSLSDNIGAIGLQMPFGTKTVKFVDSDGDGVADANDRCPATPSGVSVDAAGCEVDSDGDGVANSADKCPNTPRGTRVDASGCGLDSDGDGVADSMDQCPNTVRGAAVDAKGCERDDDGDGVVNRLDKCPNTRAGAQVDVAGCEIEAEIKLPGVNFESNSDRLLPGAERVLNDAAATLQRNPSISVEVAGHTDSDGAAAYNESLSERRAATVRDYLAARGVPTNRMTVRGYGEAEPVASNASATGKAENRRVVLRITDR
ncbi:MAG: OmpA family protein [Halioglobus sp.]|nr:OmpA family protein [Halioglobus sp.]